jgi:3-phenylpropionate/trans-cinnamate dioxygenase ferredoxin reductase component
MELSPGTLGSDSNVAIVGAGHAGAGAAVLLRQEGYAGRITLIGDEPSQPYQRPPLSKAYLKGEAAFERIQLKPESFWSTQNIDLRTGVKVRSIDRLNQTLVVGAEQLKYDRLVLATGVSPRPLPHMSPGVGNVVRLHSVADSDRLRESIVPGHRILILGAGYIGLEVAASARMLGAHVTVVEREPRVLSRSASHSLSNLLADVHQAHGVDLRCGVSIEKFSLASANRVDAVTLSDGSIVECDTVLVGIGSLPNDSLAREAGIECLPVGIPVDAAGRTSVPGIFAVGDVTCRQVVGFGEQMRRLESIQSANEQARQMVRALVGKPLADPEVPWFWSDEFDLKIQIAGLAEPGSQIVVRGDPELRKVAFFHVQEQRVRAVESVNAPPEFMFGKQLIKSGRRLDLEALANPDIPMKELV